MVIAHVLIISMALPWVPASQPAPAEGSYRTLKLDACKSDCIDKDYKVSAAEISRVFPEIGPQDKVADIETVEYSVRPVTIIYAPKVVAPHTEQVKKLICKLTDATLECAFAPETQYFLDDPARSFTKSEGIPLDQALLIQRLIRDGKTAGSDGKRFSLDAGHQRVYDMRLHDGVIILNFETGACSDLQDATIEGSGESAVLKLSSRGVFCS